MEGRTEGPWLLDADYEEVDIMSAGGVLVASVYNADDGPMIASAPDLVKACEAALTYLRLDSGGDPRPAIDLLRKALEKAGACPVGFLRPGG